MAIIVNKEQKRRDIACACTDLLLKNGIKNITISHIAQTANVGKGTIYEYFDNKEDIVFEIITVFIAAYKERLLELVHQNMSTKEKLFHFFFMIHSDEKGQKQLVLYREFLAIAMTHGTEKMREFNIKCRVLFADILNQIIAIGIENNELNKSFHVLNGALLTFSLGLIIDTQTIALNPRDEIRLFLDTLIEKEI